MLETILQFVQTIPWYWVLMLAFFLTFLENIFPPSPSDAIIVFMGALVTSGDIGFIPLLIAATLGSTFGFVSMFWLGFKFEKKIIESDRIKFISRTTIDKVERWFQKWGYWLIIANRFLSGTRAVIAFFAGMSLLSLKRSTILSFFSALLWNAILLYLGYVFGNNLEQVDRYMDLYGSILAKSALLILLVYSIYKYFDNKKLSN